MAIVIIDATTVTVDTYGELKTVLENAAYTSYTTVHLNDNITMEGGIIIAPARTSVTIDGQHYGSTTIFHTVTDKQSDLDTDTIGVRDTSNVEVTYRNIEWTGYNSNGIFFAPDIDGLQGVTIIMENLIYTGPRCANHILGLVRFAGGCRITLVSRAGISDAQEAAVLNRLIIGGNLSIVQNEESISSTFAFYYADKTFELMPGALLDIITVNDVMQVTGTPLQLTVGEYASFLADTAYGMLRNDTQAFSSVFIGSYARFEFVQATEKGLVSPFYCNETFNVSEGATVDLRGYFYDGTSLITFPVAGGALRLNNPKRFALYSLESGSIKFGAETEFSIAAGQINYWQAAAAVNPGGLDDVPLYSWRKQDGTMAMVSGTASGAVTTVVSTNLSPDEQTGKPISNLQFFNSCAFSVGTQDLAVDVIANDGYPVTGITDASANVKVSYLDKSFEGTADDLGAFSVDTEVIPLDEEVTVTTNIPFLLSSEVLTAVDGGELLILEPIEEMKFILSVIATDPAVLCGREKPGWTLQVEDSRIHSEEWYLKVTINGPLTSEVNPLHTVPGALVHVDAANEVHPLGSVPVQVFKGEGNGGDTSLVTDVNWDAVKGILIKMVGIPYYNHETYRSNLHWEVTDQIT